MERFIREKRLWIFTKLAEKELLRADAPRKQYVNGEGFPHLGRSYRLLLVPGQDAPLKLEQGRFKLRAALASEGRATFVRWYTAHAQPWLSDRVERHAARLNAAPSQVVVQDLGYRWGSCGKGNKLYFHWKSILLPPRIVEYIVVHELVHLQQPHHTPEFWQRLERALPDFAARKQWLAQNAGLVEGL